MVTEYSTKLFGKLLAKKAGSKFIGLCYHTTMKLFLSSEAISDGLAPAFFELVGKAPGDTKIVIIENAADVSRGNKSWVLDNRKQIVSLGCHVELVDLKDYKNKLAELEAALGQGDVIWLGGGNTYYLRWILHETGADKIIIKLVRHGKVYGGGSAGAIMAGPTLQYFEAADDPSLAPVLILDGLGLTDIVTVPHWDDEDYGPIVKTANDHLRKAGFKTQPITQVQALGIDGTIHNLVT